MVSTGAERVPWWAWLWPLLACAALAAKAGGGGLSGLLAPVTAVVLVATVFAAVYLVTFWSGFRGGDRAMVARPHIEGFVTAGVPEVPGAAAGAEAS